MSQRNLGFVETEAPIQCPLWIPRIQTLQDARPDAHSENGRCHGNPDRHRCIRCRSRARSTCDQSYGRFPSQQPLSLDRPNPLRTGCKRFEQALLSTWESRPAVTAMEHTNCPCRRQGTSELLACQQPFKAQRPSPSNAGTPAHADAHRQQPASRSSPETPPAASSRRHREHLRHRRPSPASAPRRQVRN